MTISKRALALKEEAWPAADLEPVPACPVCAETRRTLMHDDLWDGSFEAAPGLWCLYRCSNCRSGYLDPRPTEASIGRAYSRYYTHQFSERPPIEKKGLAALKEALGNGYRNWRFGFNARPALRLGALVGLALPQTRKDTDHVMRYLPRKRGKLLDLGCGAGEFLKRAQQIGWEAFGAEPDPAAAAVARSSGAAVREGGIEAWSDHPRYFDAVTLNHVIEHVHDPLKTMKAVFDVTRPGGMVYIETPNIDAPTYLAYGADWRGLETPRHLVIFSYRALAKMLADAGFEAIRTRNAPSPASFLHGESQRIAADNDPGIARPVQPDAGYDKLREIEKREFLTVTCRRPR